MIELDKIKDFGRKENLKERLEDWRLVLAITFILTIILLLWVAYIQIKINNII